MKSFLPDGASVQVAAAGTRILQTKIILPDPPEEIQATLLRAKEFDLHVAATSEAIRFEEVPGILVAREYEKCALVGEYPDPIIFVEQDEAVAVIAQFGDFPIEIDAVDKILGSEHLF